MGAATVTQTFTLHPGWNSIYLEVLPADTKMSSVFAGIPADRLVMIWSYFPTTTPLEYIQDPSAGLWNVAGWNVYLPPGTTDAATLTNLFEVQDHHGYLIKLNGSADVTLTVSGTPVYREISWRPDSFTLTGLALDPAISVRSGDYFFNSPAHNAQLRYRLDPNGTWIPLSDSSIVQSGIGYWIYSKGPSTYSAPLAVEFDGSDRLDFGATVESRKLVLRNLAASALNVLVANPGGLPLVYSSVNTVTNRREWKTLDSLTENVPAGSTVTLTVGVRRAGLPAISETLLNVSAQGIVRRVIVSVQNPVAGMANPNTGLWIGNVTLNAVSEAHSTDPTVTTTTPAEFTMRIILHVDGGGATRLLKEVTLLQRGPSLVEPGTPPIVGKFVLVSNPSLLTSFQTPGNRDRARFAPRVTSIGYDFSGVALVLGGTFGGSLAGNIVMPRDYPTNPFKHRYHPDHDDLTASYAAPPANLPPEQQEVWEISRNLHINFAAPPGGDLSPASGYSTKTGTYSESITGLHKRTLVTSGNFTLQRINTIAELNPAP